MREEDFENIRILSAKERLENVGLYSLTKEEHLLLKQLQKDFDKIDKSVGKTIFYMHDLLGIDFNDIAIILNYSYQTVRTRYYETKAILTT